MRKSANYESDNGAITIRPNMKDYMIENGTEKTVPPYLAYITIFTSNSKIHINVELITEVKEMLQAIEDRYITKKSANKPSN